MQGLEMRDLIAQDLLVNCDQGQAFKMRLRHEQSVKRVAMQGRQGACPFGVFDGDRQGRKSVPGNGCDRFPLQFP